MVTKAYKKYLASERWKIKRELVFRKYGKKCYACGTQVPPIHIHHMDYARFGNELLTDLLPLCLDCHRVVTRIYKRNRRRGLRRVTLEYVRMKRMAANKSRRK